MNILLISQCDKRALTESRRILDQFAERRGDRTWQTPITDAGLQTLRRLLRKTARKNTAVACHWIRGRDHSELLWIVGDGRRFNAEGAVPTNTTSRDVRRACDENDWHSLPLIHLMSAMAALLHDLGKACLAFQQRLRTPLMERNEYRHEWISLRLFQAFVGANSDDAQWLQRLINPSPADDACWQDADRLFRDGLDLHTGSHPPLAALPPLARAIGWLVLTHHRLPVMPSLDDAGKYLRLGAKISGFHASQLEDLTARIACDWNECPSGVNRANVDRYWTFPDGLPVTTPLWRNRAARIAVRLLEHARNPVQRDCLADPYIMHVSRLIVMLADHHYSRLTGIGRLKGAPGYPVYANTDRKTGALCQPLDEHLLGVEKHAAGIAHALPDFEQHLPRLARHKTLQRRSANERFRWQDRATDVALAMRERSGRQGAFLVNMASTGCGKTLGNARIMHALADPARGMRCAFAMGLRTLTLQTGRVFRDTLGLSDDELAIKVGGAASRELFEFHERVAEHSGSASSQDLLAEDGHVLYEGNAQHPLLQRLSDDAQVRSLLAAPILVCTVDHLTPATESQRGGHQIAPMLRLMSGDLVLDEPDDFDIADLPALTRLVHWAGLLGARVLLSSATLPPALVEGLFHAYLEGRRSFQRNRGERPGETPEICCAWFDEHGQVQSACANAASFRESHIQFAGKRHDRLGRDPVRRRGELLPMTLHGKRPEEIRHALAQHIRDAATRLHQEHHSLDPHSGRRVSFGLVRMANIQPLFDVALALYALGAHSGYQIHLCVYHSQFPLLIRSLIEQRLDRALDRRTPDAIFELPDIRQRIDRHDAPDQLFIVLGSPVTEVGRDHDYDWAVVEPSSMRSLIQLAGRVRRHRPGAVDTTNVLLLERNVRSLEQPGAPAFWRPGFETEDATFRLSSHTLDVLLATDEYRSIDARPRIIARTPENQRPRESLVDLEHARLARQMLPPACPPKPQTKRQVRNGIQPEVPSINASTHWLHPHITLTAVLPQQQRFRDDGGRPRTELVLLPNEDDTGYLLHRVVPGKMPWESTYALVDANLLHRLPDACVTGVGIAPWGDMDYWQVLLDHAAAQDMPLQRCAQRYGTVTVYDATQGWWFHPTLGFSRKS